MANYHEPGHPVHQETPAEKLARHRGHEMVASVWAIALVFSIVFAIATAGIGLPVLGIVLLTGLALAVISAVRR